MTEEAAGDVQITSRDGSRPLPRTGKRAAWQRAVLLEVVPRTPRISSIFLAPERPFSFVPGQHLGVRVLRSGTTAERKYSIACAPEAGAILELAIEAMPGGEVSGYFHRAARPGDTVEIRGPRGNFTWSIADGPALLIGGGSGLAPLMSMIRHHNLRGSPVPLGLIYSAATWDDVLFRDELLSLAGAPREFELLLTLTREQPRQAGVRSGRVDAAMLADMLKQLPDTPRVLVCGGGPFVDHVAGLLERARVPRSRVSVEKY